MSNAVLIINGIVFPMTGRRIAFDPGAVLFADNEILAVGNREDVQRHPAAAHAQIVDAGGMAVLPGLHNCHLHSGLLRGTAESMSLWDWLKFYVDPSHKALTPEIARTASSLAYSEGVLSGTTSVMDMWRYMDQSAEVAERVGIRATLVPYVADLPPYDYFETLATNRALLESHRNFADGRVRTWVGLEHWIYCSPGAFAQAVELAEEFDTGIHTHSSESIWEVQECLKRFGRRPIEQFYNWGILGSKTVIAHCVWVSDREIEILAQTGTSVAHCPCSNMKLSSGAAPIGKMREAGIAVGIGSDGEKENNNLDLIEEMKFASLLQKVTTLDPVQGSPWDILEMATIGGAKTLGLDGITGSLEAGKRADIITVDLSGLHSTPLLHGSDFNAAAHLVFSTSGRDVRNVWVDGQLLVDAGVPQTFDIASVRSEAQAAAEELFDRRSSLQKSGGVPTPPAELSEAPLPS
ncbi:MAG: amidohydrolase [Microbacteriaceae bacterium]